MKKLSKNKKLNGVLNYILEELQLFGVEEVERYKKEFPREVDFNIYQYGNLTIYNDAIVDIYRSNGYKVENYSTSQLVDAYKRQVGYVARFYI